MNVLISTNAFKGTMDAREAGEIIQQFLAENFPAFSTVLVPVADGGDGTCELLTDSLQLEKVHTISLDAYGRPMNSAFGWDADQKKAYIDVSSASGIASLGNQVKQLEVASSYGTGLLVQKAVGLGATEVVLGLGGSATIDLGTGILAALGVSFLDEKGRDLTQFAPGYLSGIRHIQVSPNKPKIKFTCLCDVQNTFFGAHGAIPVFGPQKGLKQQDIAGFERVAKAVVNMLMKKNRTEFVDLPGFGAAGGIALGLSAFFETKIEFGSHYFFKKINLENKIQGADWVITGEGQYDVQSAEGKACFGLVKLAKSWDKKVILITGGTPTGVEEFDHVILLPKLDFSKPNYQDVAKENLRESLKELQQLESWA